MKRFLLCGLVWLAACTQGVKKDGTVCEEYRDLRCMGTPVCAMDRERGCRVCRCEDADSFEASPDDRSRPPDQEPL